MLPYRREDMDQFASDEAPYRNDRLRELVDELPQPHKHIIERLFFGGADLLEAATEIGVSPKNAREKKHQGLAWLREKLLEDHEVGPVSAAEVGSGSVRVLPLAR